MTKRTTKRFTVLATIALLGVLAAPAQADVEKGTGEFGIDLGYTEFDSKIAPAAGPRAAVRLGYYFTDVIGLEVMGAYASGSDDGVSTDLASLFVNAVVNFPQKRNLVPYFALGAGGARLDVGGLDDTGVSAQALGGARFYGQKGKFGLRLEGGLQWVDTFDTTTTYWNLSLGFTWTVGGPHPHAAQDSWRSLGQ